MSRYLVHEVFLRMLKFWHTFDREKRFATWMYQIARNTHLDLCRKRRHEKPSAREDASLCESLVSSDPAPDVVLLQQEAVALLQQALTALPLEFREVLVLSRFQDLKYEEI